MKKLEKQEMKSVQGGLMQKCSTWGDGYTRCSIRYDNNYVCRGVYDYKGNTKSLECWQAGPIGETGEV